MCLIRQSRYWTHTHESQHQTDSVFLIRFTSARWVCVPFMLWIKERKLLVLCLKSHGDVLIAFGVRSIPPAAGYLAGKAAVDTQRPIFSVCVMLLCPPRQTGHCAPTGRWGAERNTPCFIPSRPAEMTARYLTRYSTLGSSCSSTRAWFLHNWGSFVRAYRSDGQSLAKGFHSTAYNALLCDIS